MLFYLICGQKNATHAGNRNMAGPTYGRARRIPGNGHRALGAGTLAGPVRLMGAGALAEGESRAKCGGMRKNVKCTSIKTHRIQ